MSEGVGSGAGYKLQWYHMVQYECHSENHLTGACLIFYQTSQRRVHAEGWKVWLCAFSFRLLGVVSVQAEGLNKCSISQRIRHWWKDTTPLGFIREALILGRVRHSWAPANMLSWSGATIHSPAAKDNDISHISVLNSVDHVVKRDKSPEPHHFTKGGARGVKQVKKRESGESWEIPKPPNYRPITVIQQ